ncbi:fructosamine kinase family protein [Schleiferilactobacillus perolens]|uniref:Fructosamine-3-kinase n=1 Tax=Schleiferilactobacillus perolens DSM 12744 TaxID=1423792 RepID=A0A0R1MKJ1_9LACO|nr:fructosamine kinase family protein [Schleiferilactobacillus perolens]KRL08406.1 fructosamine-3-kinase [Schleiferilactobacillus perolens DSM 12744]
MQLQHAWLAQLPVSVQAISPVGGGDVNAAFHVTTPQGSVFLLVQPGRHQDFYAGEIGGLKMFEKAGVNAPRVIASGEINGDAYLLISYVKTGTGDQYALGQMVAKMHQFMSPTGQYGFDYPYKGGQISFSNTWTDSWSELFVDRRLGGLHDAIVQKGLWQADWQPTFDQLCDSLRSYFAQNPPQPSLLHGDLWGGNYLFNNQGEPVLIDPLALFGDRELDIGVTTVFGGFNDRFYSGYQDAYPLKAGFETRLHWYRLYYLMVHLNKFGAMYAGSVANELAAISR